MEGQENVGDHTTFNGQTIKHSMQGRQHEGDGHSEANHKAKEVYTDAFPGVTAQGVGEEAYHQGQVIKVVGGEPELVCPGISPS